MKPKFINKKKQNAKDPEKEKTKKEENQKCDLETPKFEAYTKPSLDDIAPIKKKVDKKKKNKNQEKEDLIIELNSESEKNQWFEEEEVETTKINKNIKTDPEIKTEKNQKSSEEIKFEEIKEVPKNLNFRKNPPKTKEFADASGNKNDLNFRKNPNEKKQNSNNDIKMPSSDKNLKFRDNEQKQQEGNTQNENDNEGKEMFFGGLIKKKIASLDNKDLIKELSNLKNILRKNKSEKLDILTKILNSFQSKKSEFNNQAIQILELLTDFADEDEEKAVELINSFFLELFFCEILKEIISQGVQNVKDQQLKEYIKMISNLQFLFEFMIKHSFSNKKPLSNFPINTIIEALELIIGSQSKSKEIEKIEKSLKYFTEYKNILSEKKKAEIKKKIDEKEQEEEKFQQEKYIKSKPMEVDITYKHQAIIDSRDIISQKRDFFPHVIGSKYDSWEQYLNNMFYLLKEVFYLNNDCNI